MKSHVSVEQNQCPVCGKAHDTGSILLHKQLKPTLAPTTLTGQSPCPDCVQKYEQGFVAMVGIDAAKSTIPKDATSIHPGDVHRTGDIAHIKHEAYNSLFNQPVPTHPSGQAFMMIFCEQFVIEMLKKMVTEYN